MPSNLFLFEGAGSNPAGVVGSYSCIRFLGDQRYLSHVVLNQACWLPLALALVEATALQHPLTTSMALNGAASTGCFTLLPNAYHAYDDGLFTPSKTFLRSQNQTSPSCPTRSSLLRHLHQENQVLRRDCQVSATGSLNI